MSTRSLKRQALRNKEAKTAATYNYVDDLQEHVRRLLRGNYLIVKELPNKQLGCWSEHVDKEVALKMAFFALEHYAYEYGMRPDEFAYEALMKYGALDWNNEE